MFEDCMSTVLQKGQNLEVVDGSTLADLICIAEESLPGRLSIANAETLSGYSDVEEIYNNDWIESEEPTDFGDNLKEGLLFEHKIFGREDYFLSLGYFQLFFIAESDTDDFLPATLKLGNYFVEIFSKSLQPIDFADVNESEVDGLEDDPFESDLIVNDGYSALSNTFDTILTCILDDTSAFKECIDTYFPIFTYESQKDSEEFNWLEIIPVVDDEKATLHVAPLVFGIIHGMEEADNYLGAIDRIWGICKGLGLDVQVSVRGYEYYAHPINNETELTIFFLEGHDENYQEPILTLNDNGYLDIGFFVQFLEVNNITSINANAFISGYTGDWIYLSLSGFNPVNKRKLVAGISFYCDQQSAEWDEWRSSFEKQFGKELRIQDSFEFTWKFEENFDEVPPYVIPLAPSDSTPELGIGCFNYDCDGLNGHIQQVVGNNALDLFIGDMSEYVEHYRMTPVLMLPEGVSAVEFINAAINTFGGVDILDDHRWSRFSDHLIKHMIDTQTERYYLVSLILMHGGNKAILEFTTNILAGSYNMGSILGLQPDDKPKYNLPLSGGQLDSIQTNFQLRELRGVNFTQFGEFQ